MTNHRNELFDVAGTADYLNIPTRQARERFNRRDFELVRVGRRLYVRRSVLDAYLDAQTIPAR